MRTPTSLFILVILATVGSSLNTVAQSDNPPPTPREPILDRAPAIGTWSVAFRYKEDTKSQADPGQSVSASKPVGERVVSVTTEKNGAVYHQISTFSTGVKKENWIIKGEQVCKNAHSDRYIHVSGNNPLAVNFLKSDFEELGWLNMSNYVGVLGEGKKAFVFEVKNVDRHPTAAEEDELNILSTEFRTRLQGKETEHATDFIKKEAQKYLQDKFGDSKSRASLDTETQLPIGYDDGTTIRAYTYSDQPGPAQAPPEVTQIIKKWQDAVKAMNARPPAP